MCIRDSLQTEDIGAQALENWPQDGGADLDRRRCLRGQIEVCLLYTSDAADERSSVDLGGRRIIKKKTAVKIRGVAYSNAH